VTIVILLPISINFALFSSVSQHFFIMQTYFILNIAENWDTFFGNLDFDFGILMTSRFCLLEYFDLITVMIIFSNQIKMVWTQSMQDAISPKEKENQKTQNCNQNPQIELQNPNLVS
jgi:hypothetical protein